QITACDHTRPDGGTQGGNSHLAGHLQAKRVVTGGLPAGIAAELEFPVAHGCRGSSGEDHSAACFWLLNGICKLLNVLEFQRDSNMCSHFVQHLPLHGKGQCFYAGKIQRQRCRSTAAVRTSASTRFSSVHHLWKDRSNLTRPIFRLGLSHL